MGFYQKFFLDFKEEETKDQNLQKIVRLTKWCGYLIKQKTQQIKWHK